ncbi:hypothetical protein KIPB_008774, partial [Kipferlia bialata]
AGLGVRERDALFDILHEVEVLCAEERTREIEAGGSGDGEGAHWAEIVSILSRSNQYFAPSSKGVEEPVYEREEREERDEEGGYDEEDVYEDTRYLGEGERDEGRERERDMGPSDSFASHGELSMHVNDVMEAETESESEGIDSEREREDRVQEVLGTRNMRDFVLSNTPRAEEEEEEGGSSVASTSEFAFGKTNSNYRKEREERERAERERERETIPKSVVSPPRPTAPKPTSNGATPTGSGSSRISGAVTGAKQYTIRSPVRRAPPPPVSSIHSIPSVPSVPGVSRPPQRVPVHTIGSPIPASRSTSGTGLGRRITRLSSPVKEISRSVSAALLEEREREREAALQREREREAERRRLLIEQRERELERERENERLTEMDMQIQQEIDRAQAREAKRERDQGAEEASGSAHHTLLRIASDHRLDMHAPPLYPDRVPCSPIVNMPPVLQGLEAPRYRPSRLGAHDNHPPMAPH